MNDSQRDQECVLTPASMVHFDHEIEGSEIGIYSNPWRVGEKDRDERQLIL